MRKSTAHTIARAALLALVAGGLVAVYNPAPRIDHEAQVAMTSASALALEGATVATRELRG